MPGRYRIAFHMFILPSPRCPKTDRARLWTRTVASYAECESSLDGRCDILAYCQRLHSRGIVQSDLSTFSHPSREKYRQSAGLHLLRRWEYCRCTNHSWYSYTVLHPRFQATAANTCSAQLSVIASTWLLVIGYWPELRLLRYRVIGYLYDVLLGIQ